MRNDKEDCHARKRQLSENAELSTEQNCNMIDGVPNNTPIPPASPELDAKPLDKVKEPKERRKGRELERCEAGISNAGAYVRKMALNGYILHVDLAPIKELISLQRRCSNNLNQVARTRAYLRRVPGGNRRIEARL